MQNKILKFIKILKLNNPIIGIDFTDKIPSDMKHFQDTACTALARVKNKEINVFFDAQKHCQLCPGADFFLGLKNISELYAEDVYVNNEHVFNNRNICRQYLKALPKIPKRLIGKKVIIKPLKIEDSFQVVILVVNSAQAGRILGLLNYNNFNKVEICPNQPTCLSFFAPLANNLPHINFIDYYDRYFQGKLNEKYLWGENEIILSLTRDHFEEIINNFEKSPHGSFKRTNINVQKIDKI